MKNEKKCSDNLPTSLRDIIEPYSFVDNLPSEADFYGASFILARQLGLKKPPRSFSTWSHGCSDHSLRYKEQIIWANPLVIKNILVSNKSVSGFLSGAGVKRVKAVGMPILYVDGVSLERQKRSVLFMPAHSLSYVDINYETDTFLDEAKKIRQLGLYVCFCIHYDCFKKGAFIKKLDREGIDWFVGAAANDINSLQRIRNVFLYFETVTSNTIGSHFYYAQLFGAKFYFLPPYFEYKAELFVDCPRWKDKSLKHVFDHNRKESNENSTRQRFPAYFRGYENALCDSEMAGRVCGVKCKVGAAHLASLLGWGMWDQVFYGLKFFLIRVVRKIQNVLYDIRVI